MKANIYRVLNHPTGEKTLYSKTRAGWYVAAGYTVEQDTEKIGPNQKDAN